MVSYLAIGAALGNPRNSCTALAGRQPYD